MGLAAGLQQVQLVDEQKSNGGAAVLVGYDLIGWHSEKTEGWVSDYEAGFSRLCALGL